MKQLSQVDFRATAVFKSKMNLKSSSSLNVTSHDSQRRTTLSIGKKKEMSLYDVSRLVKMYDEAKNSLANTQKRIS